MKSILHKSVQPLITFNIVILFTLAQLNNVHYDPLPQFWAEITFASLSLSLFLITCFSIPKLYIPKITLPLLAFAIYISVQPYLVHITFVGLSYITSVEFILCSLLAISFSSIAQKYGLKYTVTVISKALIIGAVIQSIIGLLQYTGYYKLFGNIIFFDSAHPQTDIFGHFGQRNHYCHYMSWATFGLIYLYIEEKLNKLTFAVILAWFMFSITIAASRTVFIYFILAMLITLLHYVFNRNSKALRLLTVTIIAFIALFVFEYGFPLIQHIFDTNTKHIIDSGLERIQSSSGDLFGRRLIEWQKAWVTFKTYPMFGFGLNEFAHQSVFLEPLFKHTPPNDGLFTNCHNLILQLLAETGIIGTFIVITGCIWAIYSLIKQNNIEQVILLCLIATTLAHSMLEYPLWYLYFLGPLIIFLSLDKPLFNLNSNAVAAIVTLPVAYMVYNLIAGSFIYNKLVDYNNPPDNDQKSFSKQAQYLENLIQNNTLWSYPASYSLDNYITVNSKASNQAFSLASQIKYESLLAQSHPYPEVLIKLSKLYENNGNHKLAAEYVTLAISSFPVYKSNFLKSLKDKRYSALSNIVKNYKQ